MAEDRKTVQLHKKGQPNEQWIPLTSGECVQLTDYDNNGETGEIEQTDTLNTALAKLENDKVTRGETLASRQHRTRRPCVHNRHRRHTQRLY